MAQNKMSRKDKINGGIFRFRSDFEPPLLALIAYPGGHSEKIRGIGKFLWCSRTTYGRKLGGSLNERYDQGEQDRPPKKFFHEGTLS